MRAFRGKEFFMTARIKAEVGWEIVRKSTHTLSWQILAIFFLVLVTNQPKLFDDSIMRGRWLRCLNSTFILRCHPFLFVIFFLYHIQAHGWFRRGERETGLVWGRGLVLPPIPHWLQIKPVSPQGLGQKEGKQVW